MTFHLLPILWLLSLIPTISARCQTFQPQYLNNNSIDYAFTATQRSFVASAVVNCSTAPGQTTPGVFSGNETMRCESNQCYLTVPTDYYIRINRTLSISVDSRTEQAIFSLVAQYFGAARDRTDLNQSKVWQVTQAATCVNESMAAYWGFTPTYSCVEGNLTGCDSGSDGVAEGTFIRACGVRFLPAVRGMADGTLGVVQAVGYDSQPAPPNATEVASSMASRGVYTGFGMVLPFVIGLVIFLNMGF